ncbi:TonB-dependent siderophore receptor [Roseateles cavernae]|uniref:TonB-dependent siderophore receptor n=1 Tax=Roseateles cavernae TaxID=3153578 RepID=UPI0032E3FC2B
MSPIANHPFRPTLLATALALSCNSLLAQTAAPPPNAASPAAVAGEPDRGDDKAASLPRVSVKANALRGVTPGTITSTTKGEAQALTTPQSISVVTRELMESRQDKTLVDAVAGVAGVVSGERGNRGFDDIGIRGQVFGQEKYIDGLSTMRQGYVPAEEIFGAERVEVLKGPASLLYGNVRPGGMVNVVSKRPRREAFGALGLTIGSYGFKQITADLGRPLSDDGRSAFRVAALANDSDDVVDHVYFKNNYVAPSFRFALTDRTELTLLTSHQDREWLRLQGLPPKGTVLPNINGPVSRSFYAGEPGFGHNEFSRTRVGYELQHRFGEGWTLQQNFRWDDYVLKQRASAFLGALAANQRTQSRTGSIQDDDYRTVALDSYVNGKVETAIGTHDLTLGLDLNDKHGRLSSQACTAANMGTIDLFAPVYGRSISCTGALADSTQDIRSAGLYARDRLSLSRSLHLSAGLRHDRVTARTFNNRTSAVSSQSRDSASTGMLGLSWEVATGIAPYASWANSFVPISGTDFGGKAFKPETGRQLEAGIKFERDGGRQVASIAVYDLRRQNVTTNDPVNSGFSVQQGEHHSQGLELEAAAELRNGLSLTAAYAYTDAVVSKSNASRVINGATRYEQGATVINVPRHSANVWAVYRLSSGPLAGFGVGFGLRHVSERTGYAYDFAIPGYTVFDAALQYQGTGWRAALNVRNLADKSIYGGALNNDVVTLGEVRQVRLNVVYEF